MEGRASTFKRVLADFESRLHGAEFVAIDTELTGVDIEGEPDTFEESAAMRLEKICRIAERYTLIQLGLTIVARTGVGEGCYSCASYNLFAFPYVGPALLGREPGFFCQASALQFNAQHRVNFNAWIGEGVPYMSREDERRYLKSPGAKEDSGLDEKVGLLRLWKSLCSAHLPFVVHGPLDLFFLLAAFERPVLPREDPQALAMMIRQCTPKVYDTAHLHGALGRFRRLGLTKFFEDAKAHYETLDSSNGNGAPPLKFELLGETAVRYSKPAEQLAHEAGFDSLMTAQLFLYLRGISPTCVQKEANKLFLFRSTEFLDFENLGRERPEVGTPMFDLSRVILLVASLDPLDVHEAPRLISAAGSTYKWMDSTHILVVLRASGGAAVRKAAELAANVRGVVSWMPFEDWRASQVARASEIGSSTTSGPTSLSEPASLEGRSSCDVTPDEPDEAEAAAEAETPTAPAESGCGSNRGSEESSSSCDGADVTGPLPRKAEAPQASMATGRPARKTSRGLGLTVLAALVGGLLMLLAVQEESRLRAAVARLFQRWRRS